MSLKFDQSDTTSIDLISAQYFHITLKRLCRHIDEMFVSSCTGGLGGIGSCDYTDVL